MAGQVALGCAELRMDQRPSLHMTLSALGLEVEGTHSGSQCLGSFLSTDLVWWAFHGGPWAGNSQGAGPEQRSGVPGACSGLVARLWMSWYLF